MREMSESVLGSSDNIDQVRGTSRGGQTRETNLSVSDQVNPECFTVVLEAQRGHGKDYVLAIDSLPLLRLTLFRGCNTKQCVNRRQ